MELAGNDKTLDKQNQKDNWIKEITRRGEEPSEKKLPQLLISDNN